MRHTYYYRVLQQDDFAGNDIVQRPLPHNFQYLVRGSLPRAAAFLLHHVVATPIVFAVQKLYYRERIVNRSCIRPYLRRGVYLYGNHTRRAGDAFAPHRVAFPHKAYLVTGQDAFSLPGLRWVVKALGGLPLPKTKAQAHAFSASLRELSKSKQSVALYPEAHIWPYYTGIRPFSDGSVIYPVRDGKPVFCFTATYQQRRLGSRPKTTVYVDGPFFPDPTLPPAAQRRALRNTVYHAMLERSAASSYAYHAYYPATKEPFADGSA